MRYFLFCYMAPHDKFISKTIARWMVEILNKSGVTMFKAHSVWASVSSKALLKGLTSIGKPAGWSNFGTFATFHRKLINEQNFGSFLLSS